MNDLKFSLIIITSLSFGNLMGSAAQSFCKRTPNYRNTQLPLEKTVIAYGERDSVCGLMEDGTSESIVQNLISKSLITTANPSRLLLYATLYGYPSVISKVIKLDPKSHCDLKGRFFGLTPNEIKEKGFAIHSNPRKQAQIEKCAKLLELNATYRSNCSLKKKPHASSHHNNENVWYPNSNIKTLNIKPGKIGFKK